MKLILLLAALAALPASGLRAESTVDGFKAELLSADNAFCAKAAKDGVLQAFLSVATPDTKLLSEILRGFEGVKSGFKDWPPKATLTWKPSEAQASVSGDLGYTWGRYEYRDLTASGKLVVETGTYVTIWRRHADSSWKVVLDGGTPDPRGP